MTSITNVTSSDAHAIDQIETMVAIFSLCLQLYLLAKGRPTYTGVSKVYEYLGVSVKVRVCRHCISRRSTCFDLHSSCCMLTKVFRTTCYLGVQPCFDTKQRPLPMSSMLYPVGHTHGAMATSCARRAIRFTLWHGRPLRNHTRWS